MYQACKRTHTGITWHNKTYTTWPDENQTFITYTQTMPSRYTQPYNLLLTISEVLHFTAVEYSIKVSQPLL